MIKTSEYPWRIRYQLLISIKIKTTVMIKIIRFITMITNMQNEEMLFLNKYPRTSRTISTNFDKFLIWVKRRYSLLTQLMHFYLLYKCNTITNANVITFSYANNAKFRSSHKSPALVQQLPIKDKYTFKLLLKCKPAQSNRCSHKVQNFIRNRTPKPVKKKKKKKKKGNTTLATLPLWKILEFQPKSVC